MSAGVSTRCPKCQAALKLKSAGAAGKTVRCPKCRSSFVVKVDAGQKPETAGAAPDPDAELDFGDLDLSENTAPAATPAPVRGKPKKRRHVEEAPPEEELQSSWMAMLFRALICVNAHLAIAAVVLESLWELFWMLTH